MQFEACSIPDVVKITPVRHADSRGYFSEIFRQDLFDAHIGATTFVQSNQSLSRNAGTIRGLHFQIAPAAQGKLVMCVKGAIRDVAVDLRRASPTFRQHVAVELSADTGTQLWIPEGFAHGFCTLTPDTEVVYAVTRPYSPSHERGVLWHDSDLHIDWPISVEQAHCSDKDARLLRLQDLDSLF